jgi:ubiquitin carboxyl-terminal hydrolase 9/24
MHRTTSSPDAREEVVNQEHETSEEQHETQVIEDTTTLTEVSFPVDLLERLDDMINRPRWVIPVLPRGELEVLLDASIALAKQGLDSSNEACQRFYRDGLVVSFTKILTDDAVTGWKTEIHVSQSCLKESRIY